MTKRNFGKDYKTLRELAPILDNGGLIINDMQKALCCLAFLCNGTGKQDAKAIGSLSMTIFKHT